MDSTEIFNEIEGDNTNIIKGAAVVMWLSSWLAEQEDWGSMPGLAT